VRRSRTRQPPPLELPSALAATEPPVLCGRCKMKGDGACARCYERRLWQQILTLKGQTYAMLSPMDARLTGATAAAVIQQVSGLRDALARQSEQFNLIAGQVRRVVELVCPTGGVAGPRPG